MSEQPVCFVISPIGKEGSDIRARADKILKHVITPVAEDCGYEVIRADKISAPGMITTQVINHILNDKMVLADLTDHNANVFYELAVRHAVRRPYVQVIQTGQPIPFDLSGMRTIDFDHTDLDSVARAKIDIKNQMLSTSAGEATLESPISVAIDLDNLRRSGDPEKRQLADILNGLSELKSLIEKKIPDGRRTDFGRLYLDARRRLDAIQNYQYYDPDPRVKTALRAAFMDMLREEKTEKEELENEDDE